MLGEDYIGKITLIAAKAANGTSLNLVPKTVGERIVWTMHFNQILAKQGDRARGVDMACA